MTRPDSDLYIALYADSYERHSKVSRAFGHHHRYGNLHDSSLRVKMVDMYMTALNTFRGRNAIAEMMVQVD